MKKTLLALALAAGLVGTAQADSTVSASNGTIHQTNGLTGFQTDGNEMDGMLITATFASGVVEQATWVDNPAAGATCGRAQGSGWSVAMCGDTFGGIWTLTNSLTAALTYLQFDGQPGRTVFDRTSPSPGTADSANGMDFSYTGPLQLAAAYTDILAVIPNAPVGDLYTRVNVTIQGGLAGTTAPAVLTFVMDTDTATSNIIRVPEPASLALVSLGLLAAGVSRRSKKT